MGSNFLIGITFKNWNSTFYILLQNTFLVEVKSAYLQTRQIISLPSKFGIFWKKNQLCVHLDTYFLFL